MFIHSYNAGTKACARLGCYMRGRKNEHRMLRNGSGSCHFQTPPICARSRFFSSSNSLEEVCVLLMSRRKQNGDRMFLLFDTISTNTMRVMARWGACRHKRRCSPEECMCNQRYLIWLQFNHCSQSFAYCSQSLQVIVCIRSVWD